MLLKTSFWEITQLLLLEKKWELQNGKIMEARRNVGKRQRQKVKQPKVWEEVSLPRSPKPDPISNIQLKVPITPKMKALTPG